VIVSYAHALPAVPVVPAHPVAAAPVAVAANQSQVEVKLPADARLFVDGQAVPLSGNARTFRTPALEAGREYYYSVKVEAVRDGQTVSKVERVVVAAGRTVRVDLSDLAGTATPKEEAAGPARVTVELPADARLFIDDVACPLTSATRSFETPRLEPGQKYTYTLRAEIVRDGKTVSKLRKVEMQAGSKVNVKFEEMDAIQAASR
jgi:uncharacterized protein (TIGR03000 family)